MAKFLIKHWVNIDVIAEKVVDESEIDQNTNDLKKNKTPDSTFSYVVLQGSEKIKRTTYEKYDEEFKQHSQNTPSDK